MFLPHPHRIHTFFDASSCSFEDSIRWASAYIVEREVTESQRNQTKKSHYERDLEHLKTKKHEYIG
jgi:hypothetical protein